MWLPNVSETDPIILWTRSIKDWSNGCRNWASAHGCLSINDENFQRKFYFTRDKRHLGATYDNEWENRKSVLKIPNNLWIKNIRECKRNNERGWWSLKCDVLAQPRICGTMWKNFAGVADRPSKALKVGMRRRKQMIGLRKTKDGRW